MTSIGNATPLVCVVVLLLALVVPPAAQQGDGCPPCDCSQNTVSVGVLIGACVAVLVGTLIIEALAILCYRKYCRDREKPQKVAHRFMVSPDEELVVKENLAYESDSDAQERSLREAKEKKRASIFSISETKDNMLYVPALYRNPITKDRDTGNAIMNGYHDYEPDYGVDSMFTYNAGWGSRVPNILSGKGNTNSLESLYMDADEYPILQTPQGVGHVNFTSSKYRDGFGRKSIDIHEDDGEVTTYTYTTGFGGKVRREVATVTTDPGDEMEIKGDRVTWRKLRAPDEVVLDMDEEEAKPETRISIDDNFTIGKPTSTKRQQYTEAEIHSDSPGTSYDPSGNFILRATPSTSRSDSSDDDLYDYGDSIEGQQHFQNMQKHSEPGKIGHGTFRATVGGIPLDHGSSEEETPTELFNSRYRYSTGLNKAKLIAMRAAAAAHAREQILHEEGPTEDQDDKTPVIGYIKLVKPDSDTDGSSEGQEYRVMPTRDPDSPNTVRLYPVNSTGQPITIQTHAPGGFSQDSYIRHRRETYIEVADAGLQCGMSPKGDRPGISQPGVTQERTSILKDRTSYNLEMNTVDDIPTIGVIRLMHPKSSKHVRIREDQTESSTITFSEEDLTSASLEDVTYRSTSRSTDRSSPRPRRARSAPARSEHAHIPEDDRHPFKEVPTIGVIRLVRQDTASESSGVESEIASGEDSAPEDRPRGQKTDKWTQHEVPIVRLAQQILQESVHERASSRQSQSRFDQDTDNIPTIGVVRLVRPRSTVSDVRPMTGSRTEEYFETTEETTQQVATPRDTPVSDMPTIGIIKLLKPNSRREPTTRIPVSVVDRGTQPANTWAQLLREMHSMVESEILRKTSRKQQHDQSTDETDALPRTISIIKLKREEEQVQHQVPFSQMDRSTQSSAEMRDEETMPTFTWSHLIHEVEDQIESRYKRMSAPTPKDNFEVSKSVQKLGIIQLKAAPEKIIRDSFTQISGPHTYEKSTGPAWSFQELVEEVEEEAVQKFKRTLKQLDRPAEQQDLHEPVRSVSVIKLKKEPAQEKLVRDSVTQISGPHMYEKSTGPVKTFEEIREEIEEEALREFKRTLSLLNRPAVFQEVSEPVQAVSVIKLKKGPEAQKPTVINRGVQPDLPWRELKEEIEDEAIEEYKKHMRRFQPKEVVQQVPTTQAPSVSVIKLKGPKTMPAPEKWDNITQCDLIKPKPLMTDQVTEPTRPWSDVLHNVRRILENEYRRTITELETRLMSSPKDEPAAEAVVPTVAVFKLKGPDVQPEPEKPTMVSEKTQAAPHTAEQETAPDRPWTSILTDVRKILENEYRRTIRELEDQLNGRDETDSGKTMAYFKLSTPEIPKVQTVSMYTQIDAPHTGEQGTVPERPWGQVVKDIRSSVENEYRVTIRELESQLAERPKEGPKGPTRLGIFKLKGPKQMKVKKPVVHDTFTEPTKPWLTLLSDIEENVERRLSLKAVKPIAVEPEIVQQTQQIVEMALQKKPATADTMTQASQATTSSKASQSAVVRSSSVSTEANIQPQVTEQSTSCDLRPSVNEDVQVEPTTAIKYTVTEATESSDFFQIFKPELSSQETQASPSKTTTATTPQKSSLQEAGIQTCPSTKDRDILTDPSPASDFGVQVKPLHEIPHIAPTIVQPVHAPITFKEPELEKIDVTVQVVPEKNSKASSTETKKYVETFVQVGSPQPNQETFGAQVQPDVTDGHSSVVIRMKDAGTDNRQVKSTDKSTETTNVKEVRDFAILVKPDVKNRVAATNVKKFLDAFAQVDEPTQEQAETDESSVQAVPSINVTFTSMDTPKLTDAFTQLTPLTVEQGDKFIQVNAHVADVGTGTPVVNYADNSSQVAMSTLSRQVQAHALLTDASTGKELPTTETSTQSVSVAKQEVSVQVTMEIETEPAIVKAVVQGEQYSMPSLSTPPDVTDSAMQTAPQTVEFSGQVKPQTLEKFTEKKIDGSNFGLQVSQNSTDSFTQPLDILSKTVPVQVRPRTVDKATEYSESKAYCIDIGMQYIIESNEIGVSVEPEMIEDGTAMEIKLQLDVGTQADCEITVEPAIIQEVLRAPEESVALMNRNVQTSNVDTQTVPEETKHQGTSPEGMKTSDAVVQHVELTNLRDSSVQADPLVTSTGTLAVTTAYSVHAAQVKPQTTDRGMTTVIRGSNERSSMANLFPKPYVKPPCKDAFAQIQPASNLTSEGTLTDQTAVKAMSVQASPATSTQGQTSKPEVREQWSMTDKTLEKNVIELIIPQVEEPVVASIPILKAELLDKTTQMLSPSQRDAFSSTEISQTQTATQYDINNDDLSTQTDVQLDVTNSSTQMEFLVIDTTVQTLPVKRETVSLSTDVTQFKTSFAQYEPDLFRSSVSNQTAVHTSSTGFSPEQIVLKSTGISPEKANVRTSSTQYQKTVLQDHSIQTEEQEQPKVFGEEIVTVEEIEVLESAPVLPEMEMSNTETQTENEVQPIMSDVASQHEPNIKTSVVQTIHVKLESKSTSTTGPQVQESIVQYEPERFRTAVASQTSIPTSTTGSSTEKATLKTTGVSPDKTDVKASSTQYQMAVTKDNSMQTEEQEESIKFEEFITVEQAPVVEIMPVSIPVELVDAETQAELVTTDRAILTEPEKQKVMKTSDVQTTQLKLESKFTSTLGPQLKESVVQYEPERFRTAVSSQTSIPTRHTSSSTEKLSLKTTGVSPEKADVKASSTQYQMAVTKDNSMQTEEEEESIQIEEFITVEQAPVVEIMPASIPVELVNAETQAELITTDRAILTEPEKQKVMKTSDVQTTQLKLESKFTSTLGPQLKESVVQYEPERFRTAVSSQTSIPTRHTASSTEKLSLKTIGVSPEKADVKASSTQYQMAVTKDSSMQTEEHEEPIQLDEFITVEQAPVIEFMPEFSSVELVDSETQAEPIMTDQAILTRPDQQEKTTTTLVRKYTQAYVQNVPKMASVGQQMTMHRPQLVSQGTTTLKIHLTTKPTQAQPSTMSFSQMMEPTVRDHWSMTDDEPVKEIIAPQIDSVVESTPQLPVETQNADVQVEPKISSVAIEALKETAERGILVLPETREVTSQMSVHHATAYAQATVRHATISSQTDVEEKVRMKNSGIQTQQYLVTSRSYVPLKEKNYKPIEHAGDLVGIQPRGPLRAEHKTMQASISTANTSSQYTGLEQTATGFQTEETVEVSDMEVQTNPVTIIDFVPVLKDSFVQYEPMYFYSTSTQVEIPTMHQHVSAVVQNRTQETTTPIIRVQPSSSQTVAHHGKDNASQTNPMPEPEPLIAPMRTEPVLFAPPPLLPETQVAESQTDNVVLTDQSTSMQLPKVFSAYAQVGPRMQDTDTMTPVKLYAQIAVQNEPETLSQVMQTSPDVKEGTTLTENPDITHQASQYETAFVHVSSQAAPQSHDASTSSDLVFQEMIEAGTQHIMESNNFESQTSPDTREQASFTAFEMQESDCQSELTIEDLEEMLATLKKKLEEKPTVQEIIIPDKVNPVESPLSFLVDTEESGIQTFLETIQRSTSPILQEVKHVITQYEAELKDLGVQVKPDVIDKEMETFVVNVHDAAIQYASLYGKDKPTQFTPEVNDAGSITDQTEYQHNSTNTWSISLASKTMQACPKSMDKGTTPVLQQYDKRGTQTSGPETISRWTQREILWADVPIQVRPVLDDATSQTEYIIKEEIQALLKPIEKREVRLEMRSFKETNTAEIQTDPVIIKSAEPDDEKESWLDSGIDTDVQTDPVTILSDFDSEIELMDEDSQTCPVDMIDADIQVESRKEVNDTPSQTFQHLIAKTVQTEPKQVSYAGTVTTTRTVRPISSQTFPTKTENKGFQFEPVPYLTNEDIYTQTPVKLTKEQGTRALESQVKTSTTQTDEMPVIEPEIIHVANLQPVDSQMVFSAPEAEVTDTGVQASAEVIHEDSQTTRVFTTDRPSSPGISYAVAESQTVTPVRRTRDTQYESNAAPKKTQTESTVTVNMSTATDQTISQDVCLQTFLETKPEIVDRSMQHVAVVLMGYSQTEETELQHGETQTDEVEEIQFITPSPEAVEAFAQTIDDVISVGAQTEGPDIMQSGTDAPVKRLKVGTTQTLRKNTWNEGTVTEPMKSMSMSVQTDGIPVRVVDEHISPIHLQPVHAPLTLPEYKPKLLDASIQADVKTDDRSMQHDSEATQFNIYSTRVVKGEVTPTVRSEYSMMPQKKHFISHLESTAYPEEEKLTNKHFVDTPTQVKPQVNNVPVQVQPGHDDCSTATEEAILTSTEVQTDFAEEPMEEIIRVSQVPVQQTPFLDLGPILMDTGTQVEPRTTDHGMSATDPQFEGPSYLELGPMLLDTGTQARPTVSDHGMLTMMPLEPLPAWTQTELKTEDTAAQHEIYVQNAINQTFTHQKEHSTYTSIDVRQESSQATTEKKDAGVQAKTVEEVSVMTTGIQTVVIREEKPQMMDVGMQFRPLKIDQTTWTSKARTVSSHSNTEPMNMKQAMVQVAIKPQTQARATLTIPKHSRNITTQAEMKCYDACVQHDDLPDLADKGLQIKPVMVDDISETTQSRQIDQPIQVNLDGTKPSTIDVSTQHAEEKDTQDKIAQVKPISTEAGVWTEFDTKDKGNQADLPPEIDEFVHSVVTKIQHAPIPFPETMTTDRSIQHQPSYDSQTVQTSIDVAERASSPVGPVYNDGSSQTQADTCDMGFQTTSQETSTAEVQAVMSYFSEESFRMESVKEDFISAQVFTEEQHVAPLPTVQYQDAQMQYNPVTEDSTTETVSTGIDSANQSQPLTIDQATTTEITKHSQVEIQVDIGNPSVITHETAVQHDMVFKPVDAFTQIHPLTVDEGTSTVPLQRTEVSVQYIAPTDKRPSSPRVVPQTNDKGTSAQYDTSQSSTQTILLKSDVGIQSKPNTKSELTHAAIKPESHDQSTTTRPNVRAFETQTFLPKKNEGSQCDYATLVHNTSQYEKLFVADNSVQVKPVIREQANSPIFKRKEVGNASSQTDAVPGELDSSIGDLVKYVPHQPFKPNVESDFMHDYSDRLCEYLAHDEQVPVFVEHPIERIKTSSQFQPRQESSSPVWDYSEDFSSRLYDAEMTESIDIIDKLFTSDQRTFEMEEPITKDETNQAMSAPKYYIDSAVQTGDIRTKERSTSPLFPPMKEAESQFDAQIGHADTNVQAGPITASESCYTDHVSNKDVSSQADFATNEVLTSDAATQHYTLGQNISAQVEPLMMDAGMTWRVDSTPISTQAKPETLEQGTSTPKQSTPTSDMQTQAKPASVAKNTSPLTIRKNQVAVQAQVDRHHIPTQYERVSSTDAIVQMSPESREKGTSTKPENKDVSIYVIPTQRHETTQYEQSVRTVDFMVQYRAQHLDSSTQSVDFKPACLDRASSPIHIAFEEIQKDKMPITESPIQPAVIQQVSASPTQLEPFNQLDSSYLRQEIRDEIRIEVMHEIREELREELLNEVQHNFNSQIETQVHDELRTELEITLREEIREEFIEEYKEEIMMEIKEELKVEFESRIRHEFEERTRDDLEFKIRREIEPKVRRDLEPIIRREIEQEYVKETIYEVRAEAPVMYQPSEYKPEPMKPLMLDRGTSPAVKYLRDAPTQASTATTDKSSQYDTPRPLDGMTQTQVYSVERGTTSDKICTSDVPVQAKPSMIHRGTTPTAKPNRESGVQVVVQKTDKGDQFEAKPSQSDVSVQFSHNPQTVGAPCQVQPETAEQGTLMEVPQIHQTYVQTENPLQRSENTQTITNQMDAVCQSEPVFYRDTTLQVKPVTFDKSTSTQPHETGDYSAQVELLDQHEFVEKIPVKQEDSSVQHEGSMDVTDRRIQARPVVREQANSPLSFLTFEIISPQSQGPVHVPPYPVRSQEAPIESTYIKEIVTGEKVQPVEYIPPQLTSPTTSDISSLKFTYSYSNRPSSTDHAKSPLEPQIARLDYVPLKSTDLYPFQPITSQTSSYMGSFDSKYESSSHFTREVLQSMPPRCEMILLQTTAAGTTYTSAFRTSTPTTHSVVPSTLHLSRMSIMEQVMPTESSTDGTSPIFSDTESDSLPELSELEKIRRDLRLSKVILTDDQATLVGYFVNRDDETKTPDLPDSSPFSTPEYTQTSSRYEYTSRSTSNYTMQSPLRGRQHFMNLEHTPTESIPDVILDDSNDTFPAPIEESEWFKRETSAYRLNVPYDKKGSPRPGARIVHSLSPSQSPSHTPGRMSPVFLTSEHGHSMELLPIPRGMVTRLSDLLSDGIPSDDESVLPISRLSEMIEKHRELSQPPKWSAQSELPLTFKDPESEVDTTDSDTDTESFNAVMDFTDPFLHENPNFWQGGPTDFATSSTNSDVSSDDDVTVYGDCDVYSFDLPFFAPSKQTRPQRDASWMPGEPPRKRRSVIKIDRQRVREELSMSEVVLPDRPRLTGYRMSTDDSNWQRDRYNNRLSQSEPDLRRSTTSSEPFTTPPSYSTAYPYTKQQSSRIHPSPEHLMVDAGAMPALSAEIRYAKLVEKQEISHTHLSQYSRLSKSDPDLSAGQELFEFGHF
ncbi:uncharacterized protein LOC110978357 [Acanthaster planci]|uniref:Uncharacterized protein LOC110978357 n=1 Tax=Acanthaster planci TaxID=133434 RepID=A0A8B7Y6Z7_ACAPL|nr:uncharacterized protein LOC110978357 [Acanthaster planci]XP_022088988.1 uncharacterized protein LOC110978357 [Acanthaster planci]